MLVMSVMTSRLLAVPHVSGRNVEFAPPFIVWQRTRGMSISSARDADRTCRRPSMSATRRIGYFKRVLIHKINVHH